MTFSETIKFGPNREFIVNQKPFFPIMVWLQPLENIDTCHSLGINTYVGIHGQTKEAALAYLDACRERGRWCVPSFDPQLKDHPALLGWIHRDEPDMPEQGKPAEALEVTRGRYDKIKAGDPRHPVFLTLTYSFIPQASDEYKDKSFYRHYKDMTDVIGFDYYPIFGHMKTESLHIVGLGVRELIKLARPNMPVFAWIETNSGSKWISPVRQRQVRPFEIRAEVFMAIIGGARAIGYFTHAWVAAEKLGDSAYTERGGIDGDYSAFAVPEENRQEIAKINSQITRLTPVLCSPDTEGKVTVKSDGTIDILVKENEGNLYILAANLKREPVTAEFIIPALKAGTPVEVDGESRGITAKAGGFTDAFTEYAVHIYSFVKD